MAFTEHLTDISEKWLSHSLKALQSWRQQKHRHHNILEIRFNIDWTLIKSKIDHIRWLDANLIEELKKLISNLRIIGDAAAERKWEKARKYKVKFDQCLLSHQNKTNLLAIDLWRDLSVQNYNDWESGIVHERRGKKRSAINEMTLSERFRILITLVFLNVINSSFTFK